MNKTYWQNAFTLKKWLQLLTVSLIAITLALTAYFVQIKRTPGMYHKSLSNAFFVATAIYGCYALLALILSWGLGSGYKDYRANKKEDELKRKLETAKYSPASAEQRAKTKLYQEQYDNYLRDKEEAKITKNNHFVHYLMLGIALISLIPALSLAYL